MAQFDSIFKRLEREEVILPYFENSLLADKWPDAYSVEVDSSPYYGLTDPEGNAQVTGSGDGYFHPSTHPLLGARLLWYMFHPVYAPRLIYPKRNVRDMMTLTMGSALHAVIQTQFEMAGLLRPENVEYEFCNRERRVRGRLDMIVDHPEHGLVPIEVKTQNSRAYGFQNEPKLTWDAQLSIGMTETGYDFGVLLIVESGWPYDMKEFPIRRNVGLVEETYDKFAEVLEMVELDTPPPYCCGEGSAEMKKCPARFECRMADEQVVVPLSDMTAKLIGDPQ